MPGAAGVQPSTSFMLRIAAGAGNVSHLERLIIRFSTEKGRVGP